MSSQSFVFNLHFANSSRFHSPQGLNEAWAWISCYYWLLSENFTALVASQKMKNFLQKSANVRSLYQLMLQMILVLHPFCHVVCMVDCNTYRFSIIRICFLQNA